MHIPILSSGKKEKRKASVVSNSSSVGDDAAMMEKKEDKKEGKKLKLLRSRRSETPENPHPEFDTPATSRTPSPSPSQSPRSEANRADSVTRTNSLSLQPTSSPPLSLRETQTEPTPRRSSRIKEMTHVVSNTWTKARPYIERINGTIMPLEPQASSKAYYARDGVNV